MKEPGALAISSDSEFAPSADEDDSTGSDSEFEPSQFERCERVQTDARGAPPRSRLVKVSPAPRSTARVPARSSSRAKPTSKPKAKTSKGGSVGGSSKKRSPATKGGGKRAQRPPKGQKRAAGGSSSSSEGESSSSSTSSDDGSDADAAATKATGKRKGRGRSGRGKGKGAAAAALVEHAAAGTFKDQDGLDLSTSVLHCIRWSRVVLDEAHKIKSRTNSTAKAAFCLSADVRWCLTGTPLQNRVSELFSLIRFLQCDPFAYYLCSCKGCTCQSMHWQFGPSQKACEGCGQ
jgi:DNA repair protein RAD16